MANKKMIPCRVCGKEFEPCSYCQSHGDVFRWRNFACSRECAKEYIMKAESFREEQRKKRNGEIVDITNVQEEVDENFDSFMNKPMVEEKIIEETPVVSKKKSNKRKSVEVIESSIEESEEEIYETEIE